ncbi:MAG: hypothetical protein Q8M99_02650 [Methylotenera sp.]|nr:hypothetical protein [Methylotenera sp.]
MNTPTTMNKENLASFQFPITRKTWLLWVIVSALIPVLFTIVGTAFGKTILRTDPNAELIRALIFVLILGIPIIIPTLQWIPLRRLIPKLGLVPWYFASMFSGIMVVVLLFLAEKMYRPQHIFWQAAFHLNSLPSIHFTNILSLPWLTLFAWVTFSATITTIIPAFLLGKSSGIKWYLFILAAIFGACCSSIVEQLYFIFHFHDLPVRSLNGTGWVYRVEVLSYIGVLGAVFGATSGIGLILLLKVFRKVTVADSQFNSKRISLLAMIAITVSLIIYAPIVSYIVGFGGIKSGFPALHKLFTFALATDKSTGKEILRYSNTVDIAPHYPFITFTPDSKSFLMLSDEGILSRISLQSGEAVGKLGEPIGKFEQYDRAWSPDGRFFVLRTSGEEVKIPNTNYTRRQSRFRLYELPNYKILADYTHGSNDCFDHSINSMAFENDSKSLWVLCGQYYSNPKPDSVMVVKFSIPTLKIMDIRDYGNIGNGNMIARGIQSTNEGVFIWQQGYQKENRLVATNLSDNHTSLTLPDLTQSNLAGTLTLQSEKIEQGEIQLFFCGNSSDVSDPSEVETGKPTVHGFCRTLTFNIASGQLVSKIDDANHKRIFTSSELTTDKFHIETSWQDTSKVGVIVVKDKKTGQQLQKIDSLSQRLLGYSPDGQWLVTYTINKNRLRIYKVNTPH